MTTEPYEGFVPEWTRGDRLRKARVSAGYTVKQFAAATLISGKTITDYEGDRIVRVSALRLEKWAAVTGVSLHWLETGVGDPAGGPDGDELPRLDSNQQPSGYRPTLLAVA